jgi:hypothetical protein
MVRAIRARFPAPQWNWPGPPYPRVTHANGAAEVVVGLTRLRTTSKFSALQREHDHYGTFEPWIRGILQFLSTITIGRSTSTLNDAIASVRTEAGWPAPASSPFVADLNRAGDSQRPRPSLRPGSWPVAGFPER